MHNTIDLNSTLCYKIRMNMRSINLRERIPYYTNL